MLREVRTLRLQEERHPIEQDVWDEEVDYCP